MVEESRCERVVELLPWAVRGTLAEDERRLVAAHLEGCAHCREERDEVRAMFRLTARHLPAEAIADRACGLPSDGWSPAEIDEHLASCAECREDLDLAGGASAWPGAEAAAGGAWGGWRPLALAASLLACLALGALWWQARPPRPGLDAVALVEPVGESYRVRGAGDGDAVVEAGRAATVVLAPGLALEATDYRVLLLAAGGAPIAERSGLRPDASGAFALHVPAGLLTPGEVSLVLQAAAPGGWETLETFRLRVVP